MHTLLAPLRLLLHLGAMMGLLYLMNTYMVQYFWLDAGLHGYLVIASIIVLCETVIAPLLRILLFPLTLIATLPAMIAVHLGLLWIINSIAQRVDPSIAILTINGGATGWLAVAAALGTAHWLVRLILR